LRQVIGMSSVGLSFGSATSGKGIDVSSTVTQIMTNYRQVEQPWKDQLAKLQDQDAVLSTLGTGISTLLTDVQALTDAIGVFSAMNGSSSDTSVLQLTSANSSAVAGTHTVTVSNLAQTSVAASGVVGSSDILSGSVTIQVGSGSVHTIHVGDDGTASTIAGLANAINLAGIGVRASVLTDTNGSRLSVISCTDGSAGTLTVSSALTNASVTSGSQEVAFTQVQEGLDANLQVDGVSLTSASNKVTNGIQGVTFQLLSANPGEAVQVVIANDNSSILSAVNTFVTDYNKLIAEINGQEKTDGSGNAEPLYGNPVIAQLQNTLQGLLISAPTSGSVTSLYSLGITSNADGTLSLNTDRLDSILNESFSDVMEFFQNLGSFGVSFANTLNNLGSSRPSGLIALVQKMNSNQEKALNDSIDDQEARLSIIQERLTSELNQVNQTLQAIPSQLNYVNELYSDITGYNQKS
jgi:flagellar hook-associated protein 2